jgi:drug/metabolite transporter (DMT)-like permease
LIGLLGGLGAAVSWAAAALTAARASRAIGATPTLAWVMVIGLLAIAPTLAFADPGSLGAGTIGWLMLAGAANVAGLALEYLALRLGSIGVVAPLCSTEGAIAAVIAAIFGQLPSAATLVTLAVILAGVVLSSTSEDGAGAPGGDGIAVAPDPVPSRAGVGAHQNATRAAVLSIAAAILFGLNLYALARAGNQASVVWELWPARIVGTIAVALPLAARGGLKPPGRAWPYVVGSGIAEVTGILAYAAGARHGVAIPAVVGSQFAGLAALGGYLLLGERIGRRRVAGLVTIAVGVAALAALQAA